MQAAFSVPNTVTMAEPEGEKINFAMILLLLFLFLRGVSLCSSEVF